MLFARRPIWLWVVLFAACEPNCDGSPANNGPTPTGPTSPTGPTGPTGPTSPTGPSLSDLWLHTLGSKIYRSDDTIWAGRGASLPDTRGCNSCAFGPPNPGEVTRRADELIDNWGATLVRLNLESYATQGRREHWQSVVDDPRYLNDIVRIVEHITSKPHAYVMVSLWVDPSFTDQGWPTEGTRAVWALLAHAFHDEPKVLFGIANEPTYNYDGAQDDQVWAAMDAAVQTIRTVEATYGARRHLVAVQGTRGWARSLEYYLSHPIAADGGRNVVYETHVYDDASLFNERFVVPSQTLPVLIGEFGPAEESGMSLEDCAEMMRQAKTLNVPYAAWTFSSRCAPNLLIENPGWGCGFNMELQPTPWGQVLKDALRAN